MYFSFVYPLPIHIYQIQDFNPEQVLAVNYSKNKFVTGLMMFLDKFSCKHADLVITVGRDLIDTLNGRFPNGNAPKSVLINNWIDEKEIYPLEVEHPRVKAFKEQHGLSRLVTKVKSLKSRGQDIRWLI